MNASSLPWIGDLRSIRVERLVATMVALYVLVSVLALVPADLPVIVTAPPAALVLAFVPGMLFLLWTNEFKFDARSLLYALGTSLVIVMVIGFSANLLFPLFGVSQPLSLWIMGPSLGAVIGGLAFDTIRKRRGNRLSLPLPCQATPTPLAFALLPFLSILSVFLLNVTGDNRFLVGVLLVVAVVPLVTVTVVNQRWYSFGIWTTALAILYHKSLWKYAGFSGSPGVVRSYQLRRWTPGIDEVHLSSTPLLENGVLFPTLARFGDIQPLTQMQVVNPFVVAFIPLSLFVAFRSYVDARKAFLGASVFAFAHPFYIQYPTAGRAATPVLFLALFAVVLGDTDLSPVSEAVLRLSFVAGIVVSHYGTSYFVMFAFIGALVILFTLRRVERAIFSSLSESPVTDGGQLLSERVRRPERLSSENRFPPTVVLFFTAGVLAWYIYMANGSSFSLPNHIARSLSQLLSGELGSGRTAARLKRNYGTLAISLSKLLYVALAGLIGIGLLSEAYRRYLSSDDQRFNVEYNVIAAVLLATFSSTILVRNWGGGRPMMITFVFTTILAPVGLVALLKSIRFLSNASFDPHRIGEVGFSMVLVAMLLLNAGVASALVWGGGAPSNVPSQEHLQTSQNPEFRNGVYRTADISLHVWLIDNHGSGYNAYGGRFVNGQTDWYRPHIVAGTEGLQGYEGWQPRGELSDWVGNGVEPGYVVLAGHNVALGKIWGVSTGDPTTLAEIHSEFEQRSRVYANGQGAIYFSPGNATVEA